MKTWKVTPLRSTQTVIELGILAVACYLGYRLVKDGYL